MMLIKDTKLFLGLAGIAILSYLLGSATTYSYMKGKVHALEAKLATQVKPTVVAEKLPFVKPDCATWVANKADTGSWEVRCSDSKTFEISHPLN